LHKIWFGCGFLSGGSIQHHNLVRTGRSSLWKLSTSGIRHSTTTRLLFLEIACCSVLLPFPRCPKPLGLAGAAGFLLHLTHPAVARSLLRLDDIDRSESVHLAFQLPILSSTATRQGKSNQTFGSVVLSFTQYSRE
jgi:hypothetical protein